MMKKYFIRFLVIFIVVYTVFNHFLPYDDTDDKETNTRSGVSIITDYGTGCQYLYKPFGGLVPRYSGNGTEIIGCNK